MWWASGKYGAGIESTGGESIKFRQFMLHPCFIHASSMLQLGYFTLKQARMKQG
jgi:hypothetical protein